MVGVFYLPKQRKAKAFDFNKQPGVTTPGKWTKARVTM